MCVREREKERERGGGERERDRQTGILKVDEKRKRTLPYVRLVQVYTSGLRKPELHAHLLFSSQLESETES